MEVHEIILKHYPNVDVSIVNEIVDVVLDTNVIKKNTDDGGPLSTTHRRATYMTHEFGIVEPVEFRTSNRKTFVYIPILKMLQTLLSKEDILEKAFSVDQTDLEGYFTFRNGSLYKDNPLLMGANFSITLCLYIDDFEVANPLGTSKKLHKLCAVYWVLGNIPTKFRSSLNAVQLALLCKVTTVKDCGHSEILRPLLQDLMVLERHGVYVEKLGASIKGTVLYTAADHLGVHSLGGFYESFVSDKMCRFCMASRRDIQEHEVSSGYFPLRTRVDHDQHVHAVQQDGQLAREYGVKRSCPLTDSLQFFHVIGGYPPDILHNLLEGIIPCEVSLCLKDLIKKKFFTLEMLNAAIKDFPYANSVVRKSFLLKLFPKILSVAMDTKTGV